MSEIKEQTIALTVRLKPSERSAHPKATNYTNVGVARRLPRGRGRDRARQRNRVVACGPLGRA